MSPRRRIRLLLFLGAAGAAAGLIFFALSAPKNAAAGWLVGFAFWAQILVGSLLLMMIHRLTGGRWGVMIAPAIAPTVAAVPLLIVLAIPLFIAIPALYPWWHTHALKHDVLSAYLNTPGFVLRSAVALAGWAALALLLPTRAGLTAQLLAALGIVFTAILVSSVSIDWFLSLEPPFTSSSFGASVAVASLIAGLAWAALLMPASDSDPAVGDIGALLLATVLGITYIDFMAVLVIWYGDLPHEETWFVLRGRWPWPILAAAAFVLVSLIPVLGLMLSRVRNRQRPLRAIAACVLVGLAVYDCYLIAPSSGPGTLATAALALIGIGLFLSGLIAAGTLAARANEQAHVR
jgi:hypothetical protein